MPKTPAIDLHEYRVARDQGARPRINGVARGRSLFYAPGGLSSNQTPGANVLGLVPFDVPRRCLLVGLAAAVGTAGSVGSVIRLGVYRDDGTETFPGALLVDAGTIDGTSATSQTLTLTTPIPIDRGRYWVGGASQGAPATAPIVRGVGSTGAAIMPNTTNDITTQNVAAAMAGVTGALPAAFTTSVGYTSTVPLVRLRLT